MKKNKRYTYLLFLSFLSGLPFLANAQSDKIALQILVNDGITNKPISYVHVYVKGTQHGTVSNIEGGVFLDGLEESDTLVFSFIGYDIWQSSVDGLRINTNVKLYPIAEILNEVTLVNNDEYLYDLISKCKKTSTQKVKKAKTYFSLNTFVDSNQVELLECYYNGAYAGYDLRSLDLKNGRISLEPFNENYFVSISTSRALIAHKLFDKSNYFPVSPFELNRNALEKRFFVHLERKFKDERNRVVYAIKYQPKENELFHFYGKAWIDSTSGQLLKTELNADSAMLSPFIPLFPNDSLKKIAFKISKSFEIEGENMYVKSIDFNYELTYHSQRQGDYALYSNAVLYAYSYEDEFLLPFYGVQSNLMSDYRKITSAPYNAFFWENIQEFQMNDVQKKNAQFAKQTVLINDLNLSPIDLSLRKGFFEHTYVLWAQNRMHIKDKLPEGTVYEDLDGLLPSRRYNLEAHLYLDVNTLKDSTHYLVKAVYDPFRSYFHYPDSKQGDAFINMYFDLFEIEKRKLESNLRALEMYNELDIERFYNGSLEQILKTSRHYVKEVERGKDEISIKKWNKQIEQSLGIDNLRFYQLDFEE